MGLILAWVGQSEVAQYLQTAASYNKPYFIVWVNHSVLALMLPLQALWHAGRRRRQRHSAESYATGYAVLLPPSNAVADSVASGELGEAGVALQAQRALQASGMFASGMAALLRTLGVRESDVSPSPAPALDSTSACAPLTPRQFLVRAVWLSALYSAGDWFWYTGLPHVSVAAGTCIFNSSCVFTYVFSVLFLGEELTLDRICGVAMALGGVVILALAPGSNNAAEGCLGDSGVGDGCTSSTSQLAGSALVVAAAALYALYEVLCERFVFRGSDDAALANTLSGTLGLVNVCLFWPMILWLNALPSEGWRGWIAEPFETPSPEVWRCVMVNAVVALAFNAFLMLAIALTSPVITSVGCMLTIPISALCDLLLYQDSFPPLAVGGSAMVVMGFALLTRADTGAHAQAGSWK